MIGEITYHSTWLHRLNPSMKLMAFLVVFIGLLFIHNPNFLLYFIIGATLIYLFATGHTWKMIGLLALPLLIIFVSSATAMIFFGEGETTWYQFGLIHITEESFYRGLHLGLRSTVFGILSLIFALTTRPVYLFYSVMQQMKVKPAYAYSFMAGIRMLPIILEEFQTLRQAMKVRGVVFPRGVKGMYQKVKQYSIPLLAQSIRRAHRIAVAMEAKQFTKQTERTYYYKMVISLHDLLFVILLGAWMLVTFYFSMEFSLFPVENVR
ncbi:energy-coupling factor transporter transmembrane component T family protein [Gracilibacillus salinarum]|uniref:Energy-coupling factor transporter transmembrane protein EcfT n=1 Tax=Gracilibacillus salinarum TaxID=2932255 RepID=A0ABY4GN40_9BACI|nr:energy-coupling factor transporter transmembrane component T [Gracilibacillus salinarum]UOQ85796.1 energy-coupling factor transporter transmembrane protein EcfT [Gracilibacillus salinarum]